MAITHQLVTALCQSYLALNIGIGITWPSFIVELFMSDATPLSRPMTSVDISLVGSLSSVGAIVATPLYSLILDKLGRKNASVLCGLPFVVTWGTIAFTRSVELVLTALFVSGIGGGGLVICMVFVAEVAQIEVRGTLSALTLLGYSCGMLVAYTLGGFFSYHLVVYTQLVISTLFFPLLLLVKESPVYLLQIDDEKGAARSLAHYRGLPEDSKQLLEELAEIKRSVNSEVDQATELTPEQEKLEPESTLASHKKLSACQFLWQSNSSRRALRLCLLMMTSSIFMGMVAVMVYADSLFKRASPGISSVICSILLAVCMMVSSLVTAFACERAGRKMLMMYSSVGCGACTLLLASQLQLAWGPDWIAFPIILLFTFVYNLGAGTIPYMMIGEVFLPEVRSMCGTIVMETAWLLNFVMLFVFNPLVEALALHGVFYLFSVMCWITVLYCWFWMPETKGLSAEEIQPLLVTPTRRAHKLPRIKVQCS